MSEPNLKGLDQHSEEVQELMGTVPSWIQRWGISLIALILIGALALCATIRLPEQYPIELTPLATDGSTIISMPEAVRIKYIYAADNTLAEANDTLLAYTDDTFATAPIAGRVTYIGPVHKNVSIPAGTELLKVVSKSHTDSVTYYTYLPQNIASEITCGQQLTLPEIGICTIKIISDAPNSQGNHYIEITSNSPRSTPLNTHLTISDQTILQKLLATICHTPRLPSASEEVFDAVHVKGEAKAQCLVEG